MLLAVFAMSTSVSFGATITENFEDAAWGGTSYTKRTVNAPTGSWIVSGVGNMDASDRYNDTRGIRFRGGNANDTGDNLNRVEMDFDKTDGIGTVSFKYGSYSTHSGGVLNVEYSTNQGATWVAAGSTSAAPTWATGGSVLLDASFTVNVAGTARVRVTKTFVGSGSISANIDDLVITGYSGTTTTVAAPTFSPGSGTYNTPQSVTISTATEGASIRYTTDGSDPTASSTLYSAPITVASTTTIKAIATKSGMDNSAVAAATYTFHEVTDVANIAAFNALAANTVGRITGSVTVVYQASNNNMFVQDASGWLLVYGSPGGKTYQNGDLLTNLTGKFLMYGTPAYPEMELVAGFALPDAVAGTPATAPVVTPANLTNDDLNRYVAFEKVEIAADVTYSTTAAAIVDGTIINGAGTMIIRDQYKLLNASFAAGEKVNLKGIVRYYNPAIQIYLLSIEKVSSGFEEPKSDVIDVYAEKGNICVKNLKDVIEISVFDFTGKLIVQTTKTEIPLPQGAYIVKIGHDEFKVMNK